MPADAKPQQVFLPDFCAIRTVFLVVVIAEMLAIVIALAGRGTLTQRLDELALTSLFIQWVALTCAAVLCRTRPWLAGRSEPAVAAVAYILMLAVTWIVSEAAWWLVAQQPALLSLSTPTHAAFLLRNLAISAILSAFLLRYFYVQHQWQRRVKSEAQARFEALQARIRPHFLFNCMNTIASLTRVRPAAAEKAVEDLADLFRASLADARAHLSLGEELRLCRQYLDIESLRLGERLRVEWAVEALPQDAVLPALTLQPLVENAVYHGVEPRPGGGVVRIGGEVREGLLRIAIDNPLPAEAVRAPRDGNRMAQDNVRARLRSFFGDAGRSEVETREGLYRVILLFPYWQPADIGRAHPDR
jgi:two-component system sensor histidine kinase AlgZ